MALADQHGEIHAAIPGLARAANVTVKEAEKAIELFMSPDKWSRTQDHHGKRLEKIDGGWRLLNFEHYRSLMSAEERKEYKRRKEQERRDRKKSMNVHDCPRVDKNGQISAEAEAEAEAEKKEETTPKTKPMTQKNVLTTAQLAHARALPGQECY